MTIKELIERIKTFQENIDSTIIEICRDSEEKIIGFNLMQLNEGEKGEGGKITPTYAQSTIIRKRKLGQPYDRVTLKDKGDFHGSIFIEFREDEFEFKADDFKKIYLEKRYGKDIYGLNQANLQNLIELIKPQLIEKLKAAIKQ